MKKNLYVFRDDDGYVSTLKLTKQEAKTIEWFIDEFLDGSGIGIFEVDENAREIDAD